MKITEHIHSLNIPFKIITSEGNSIERSVNIFILLGKHITLIDSGVAGSDEIIFDYIRSIDRKPEEIKYVLLTHTHPDHIGALSNIKAATGCKIAVHKSEKEWLENIELQFSERPVPGFHKLVGGSCKADILFNDGDVLDYDNELHLKVIHCPGHSSGSVAFLLQQGNALFTGDVIPVKNEVPIYDDWKTCLWSLEKLENMPYPEVLLSSWAPAVIGENVDLAISDGFEVLYAVHQSFMEVVKDNKTADINEVAKLVLDKIGLPVHFINPLFVRTLKSHYQYL
jgi:glyoxylase-like metal-dependent hydrolase (beta-lactamase superfamily II)